MIRHTFHLYGMGAFLTWTVALPLRIISGDLIHNELLDNHGEYAYEYTQEEKDKRCEFSEYLRCERVTIDHNAIIVVWLKDAPEAG